MNPAFTTFVLGYHGCDRSVAEKILAGKSSPFPSENDYDWLGHGIYFWEHNAKRAFDYACEIRLRPRNGHQKIRHPAVIGAIIELAFCLNLLDSQYIELLRQAYSDLAAFHTEAGESLPVNSGGSDRLIRHLDCAVLEALHVTRADQKEQPFDTVRAAFIEGHQSTRTRGFMPKRTYSFACETWRVSKAISGHWLKTANL